MKSYNFYYFTLITIFSFSFNLACKSSSSNNVSSNKQSIVNSLDLDGDGVPNDEDCAPENSSLFQWIQASAKDADGDGQFVAIEALKVCSGNDLPVNYKFSIGESPMDCDDEDSKKWQLMPYRFVDLDGDGQYYTDDQMYYSTKKICTGQDLPEGYKYENVLGDLNLRDCAPEDAKSWRFADIMVDDDNDGYYRKLEKTNSEPRSCIGNEPQVGTLAFDINAPMDCDDKNENKQIKTLVRYEDLDGDGYFASAHGTYLCLGVGESLPNNYAVERPEKMDLLDSDSNITEAKKSSGLGAFDSQGNTYQVHVDDNPLHSKLNISSKRPDGSTLWYRSFGPNSTAIGSYDYRKAQLKLVEIDGVTHVFVFATRFLVTDIFERDITDDWGRTIDSETVYVYGEEDFVVIKIVLSENYEISKVDEIIRAQSPHPTFTDHEGCVTPNGDIVSTFFNQEGKFDPAIKFIVIGDNSPKLIGNKERIVSCDNDGSAYLMDKADSSLKFSLKKLNAQYELEWSTDIKTAFIRESDDAISIDGYVYDRFHNRLLALVNIKENAKVNSNLVAIDIETGIITRGGGEVVSDATRSRIAVDSKGQVYWATTDIAPLVPAMNNQIRIERLNSKLYRGADWTLWLETDLNEPVFLDRLHIDSHDKIQIQFRKTKEDNLIHHLGL